MTTNPSRIDFDAIYAGDGPVLAGEPSGVPWDIGAPQPAVVELERAGRFTGDVLDVGCGTGDNAIHLAANGHRVVGVDAAPGAIDRAHARAGARGVDVEFAIADAMRLPAYDARFDTVCDCALLHCLPVEDRPAYAATLYRVARPGALLNLVCVSDAAPEGTPPSRLGEAELRDVLGGAGWVLTAVRPHRLTAFIPPGVLDAMGVIGLAPAPDGRLTVPAYVVEAHRRW